MLKSTRASSSIEDKPYLEILKDRAKKSRVYRKYQLTGLLISQLLGDEKHKSLYIKLAKERNPERLLELARDVAERKNIDSKGAYFMTVLSRTRLPKNTVPAAPKQKN